MAKPADPPLPTFEITARATELRLLEGGHLALSVIVRIGMAQTLRALIFDSSGAVYLDGLPLDDDNAKALCKTATAFSDSVNKLIPALSERLSR